MRATLYSRFAREGGCARRRLLMALSGCPWERPFRADAIFAAALVLGTMALVMLTKYRLHLI